jgi:hypothetical protein
MTILGSGNVGFGTNAPAAKVHAVGSAIITEDLTVRGRVFIGPAIGGNTAYFTSDGTNMWFVDVNSVSKQLAP